MKKCVNDLVWLINKISIVYRSVIINSIYRCRFKHLGKKCYIGKPLLITPECISLGDCVYIFPNCRLEGIKGHLTQSFSPKINIEDGVTIQQNLHLTCAASIQIQQNVAIAANVSITDINHLYSNPILPIEQQSLEVKSVVIKRDSKIYNNSVILPGTSIGIHSVVGANSVVNGVFPDYCIIVGAPAKIVKRFCFDRNAWLKTNSFGDFIE